MTGGRRMLVSSWLGVLGLLLVGCAAQMPPALRSSPPAAALTVGAAREAPEQHAGTHVRWGGAILAVRNAAETTEVEVLARGELDAAGRPKPAAPAAAPDDGRFIARFSAFLDPAQYPEGRLITVTGTLSGVETRDVGAYPYRYPVVRAGGKHLWPRSEPEPDWLWRPGPWGFDPWYDWSYGPWYRPGLPAAPWYRPWYW